VAKVPGRGAACGATAPGGEIGCCRNQFSRRKGDTGGRRRGI